MKTVFSKSTRPDPELLVLKAELQEAQNDLALAYRQFNQAVDPELVESCVYQISAVKARCNYLIRAIKERSPDTAAAANKAPAEARRNGRKRPGSRMGELSPADECERYAAYKNEEGNTVWT